MNSSPTSGLGDPGPLAKLLQRWEAVLAGLREASSIDTIESRRQIVSLRRELAQMLPEFRGAIEQMYPEGGRSADEMRSKLASVRAVLSLHQAHWPASSIDYESPDYEASVAEVRATTDSVISWIKTEIRHFDTKKVGRG